MSEIAQPSTSRCVYCDLPVAGESLGEVVYCCYGCRFAHAVVEESGGEGAIRWTVIRLGLAIFFTMNLMAFTMTMWSLDVYDVDPDPFQETLFEVFRWLSMVLALPVLVLLGVPMFQNAMGSLRRRVFSTDLLIVAAVVAAYVTSVVNVVRETGTTYFEVGATVLVMITLGRWIEAAGKQKATETLDQLLTLLPKTVARIAATKDNSAQEGSTNVPAAAQAVAGFEGTALEGHRTEPQLQQTNHDANEELIASETIQIGDILRIRAGERIPVDGTIISGRSSFDEQVFTGESLPIEKGSGDTVLAGTTNMEGDLLIQTTALFQEGSFGRLLQTLQAARNAKGRHQQLSERVADRFFPAVATIAAVAFLWHLSSGIANAIQVTMSVLLIACPCALGLATPLAVWTALSTAVKRHVIFRSGEAIERLADTKAVCLDKTGTLTTGTPRVSQLATFGERDSEVFDFAAALAAASTHPFSKAVTEFLSLDCPDREANSGGRSARHGNVNAAARQERPSETLPLESIRTVSGGGVEACNSDGRMLRLGSIEFSCCRLHQLNSDAESSDVSSPELCVNCRASVPLQTRIQLDRLRMSADLQAASIVLFSIDRRPVCGFLVAETIRSEASAALNSLGELTEQIHVLSGDRKAKGRFLRKHLQLSKASITCDLSPEQKVARVREVRRDVGTTVMVGDGINDAPALAASDVGIAMGCGADVTRDSAQVCLLSNDLNHIPWAIQHARRTQSVIRQNLFWAFSYNSAGIVVAAMGLLNPAIAAALMIASSLLVISNSLRLLSDGDVAQTAPDSETFSSDGENPVELTSSTYVDVKIFEPAEVA